MKAIFWNAVHIENAKKNDTMPYQNDISLLGTGCLIVLGWALIIFIMVMTNDTFKWFK